MVFFVLGNSLIGNRLCYYARIFPGILFHNFFCVACIIFALTVFKGNGFLYILNIWRTKILLQNTLQNFSVLSSVSDNFGVHPTVYINFQYKFCSHYILNIIKYFIYVQTARPLCFFLCLNNL